MNKTVMQYWFYLFAFFVGLCILGCISIKTFKERHEIEDNPVFADKLWYKILKFLLEYGITVLVAIYFFQYALDIPFVLKDKYSVTEGKITHLYKTEIEIGDSTYEANTVGLQEGETVRIYYYPFTKIAPVVEVIE